MITPDARLASWIADLLEEVDELFVHYVGDATDNHYAPNVELRKFREHLAAFRKAFLLPERVGADERGDLRQHREELFYIERWAQLRVATQILEDRGEHEAAAAVRRLIPIPGGGG